MKTCQWCGEPFDSKVTYQVYCTANCRQEATKEKITQRYIAKRRRKMFDKKRVCKSCDLPLSVYNDELICQSCLINPPEVRKALREIKGIADGKTKLDKPTAE